jgi:hypothetical protein
MATKKKSTTTRAKKVSTKKSTPKKKASVRANGKLSMLDAAAKVLSQAAEPMGTKELIEVMVTKGLWSSPAGQTPHATLHAAVNREIKNKKGESRFRKTDRGRFALKA